MTACGDTGPRTAVRAGGAGLLCLSLACGARSSLEVGGERATKASSGAAGEGGRAITGIPVTSAGGTVAGGSGGAATPLLSAPEALRTPPTGCTIDGWCGSLGDYTAIWGSSLVDIWVAANNFKNDKPSDTNPPETPVLLHWDGLSWKLVELLDAPLVKLASIWGSSSDDVWVAGSPAYVAHFDGKSWSRTLLPTGSPLGIDAIGGAAPRDVWTAGWGLFHFDGNAWSALGDGLADPITSVWTTAGDLWIVSNGVPRRSRDGGKSWDPAAPPWNPSQPPASPSWNTVWGDQAGAPFAAGQAGALGHWADGGWVVQSIAGTDGPLNFRALAGLSTQDVWAVGDEGVVAHWDGASWTLESSPTREPLHGVWGSDGHCFAVGDHGTFLELKGGDWIGQPSARDVKAIWGGAASDVWAVGKGSLHWDGVSWGQVPQLAAQELSGAWGSAPGDVWAVGKLGGLMHYDGATWAPAPSPTSEDLAGIWGSRADDVWAVSVGGAFLHFDGQSWTIWPTPGFGALAAVYGSRGDDVVAVGDFRVHFDGHAWARLPLHPSQDPRYLTAFGDGANVFMGGMVAWSAYKAGGANPELGRWDGQSLFDNLEPDWGGNAAVQSGWANSLVDVWIAEPLLSHWDGASWSKAALSQAAMGVSALGATSEDIWAAANDGQMLRKRRH